MTVDLTTLLQQLKAFGLEAVIQKETNQVYAPLKIKQQDFPLFGRIYEGGELIQLITFVPCDLKKDAASDLARLLHLFNKEIDIPGFGMDEMSSVIYFRCMIPTVQGTVSEAVVHNFITSMKKSCEHFAEAIAVMASGATKFDEMLKKAKDASKES